MITWATSTAFLGPLSCINMTKECYQISFSQCGRVVSCVAFLYENSTDVPAFFGMNKSAVMFFSETLNLHLTNIVLGAPVTMALRLLQPTRMDLPHSTACTYLNRLEDLSALDWLTRIMAVGTTPAMGQEYWSILTTH